MKVEVTEQDKQYMANLVLESQVLSNLLTERKAIIDTKAKDILTANGLSTSLYMLKFNPGNDLWEAQLKPGSIAIPAPGTDLSKIRGN